MARADEVDDLVHDIEAGIRRLVEALKEKSEAPKPGWLLDCCIRHLASSLDCIRDERVTCPVCDLPWTRSADGEWRPGKRRDYALAKLPLPKRA